MNGSIIQWDWWQGKEREGGRVRGRMGRPVNRRERQQKREIWLLLFLLSPYGASSYHRLVAFCQVSPSDAEVERERKRRDTTMDGAIHPPTEGVSLFVAHVALVLLLEWVSFSILCLVQSIWMRDSGPSGQNRCVGNRWCRRLCKFFTSGWRMQSRKRITIILG